MGGSPTQQTEIQYPMMRKDIMQRIIHNDGSIETRGGDIPYYGDKYPMVVPSNYKEPLRNMEYIKKEQSSPAIGGSPTQNTEAPYGLKMESHKETYYPEAQSETATMMKRVEPLNLPELKKETYIAADREKIPAPLTPAEKAQEDATYARLEKQGMSDQGIVSPEQLDKAISGTWKDLTGAISKKITPMINPNAYGRDTSTSLLSSQQAIEAGLR